MEPRTEIMTKAAPPVGRKVKQDLAQTRKFLSILDPTAKEFVFQTFDDAKDEKNPVLSKVINGSLDKVADQLTRLNNQGAGIFVVVNKGGRLKKDITEFRTMFREADKPGLEPLPLEPQIVVETSPNKKHEYLLIAPGYTDGGIWDDTMKTMIIKHGSDPNAKDRSRVLRVPGFYHQKDTAHPHLVRIAHASAPAPGQDSARQRRSTLHNGRNCRAYTAYNNTKRSEKTVHTTIL